MTLGFALFAIGLAMVYSALKDKTIAEVLGGAIGEDVPLGKSAGPGGNDIGRPAGSDKKTSGNAAVLQYLQTAAKAKFGLTITEPIGRDSGGHVENSYHKRDRAFDASGLAQQEFYNWVKKNYNVTELLDEGDHIHVAI